jgi:hypothetical protein
VGFTIEVTIAMTLLLPLISIHSIHFVYEFFLKGQTNALFVGRLCILIGVAHGASDRPMKKWHFLLLNWIWMCNENQ